MQEKPIFSPENELSRDGLYTLKWECEQERAGDPTLLSFSTADMDFPCPAPVLNAIRCVADRGHLGYPGIPESYYSAIEGWLLRTTGWRVNTRACTATNVGIYTAVWTILDALTAPGDEVIIQTPVHFCFRQMLLDNGRVPVMNPLKEEHGGYVMDFDLLEKQFTAKTRLFWLCNPHNPVGRAWTAPELQRLGELCVAHGVTILTDDVYCGLLFPGAVYTPIASLSPAISHNTITCYSPSKSYNTTGVKFSFVLTENPELLEKYNHSLAKLDLTYGINLLGLTVAEAAYGQCDSWLAGLMQHIAANHALASSFITQNMPGARVTKADSAYFAWIDMRHLHLSSDELCDFFVRDAHVLINSGASLGEGGAGFMRMNLACTEVTLLQGLERLQSSYQKLL